MKVTLQIQRVEDAMEWLEATAEDYTGMQSIAWFIDHLGLLCKSMAFINGQMAVSKQILNDNKRRAYEALAASSVANMEYFAPSLAKDYIAAKVSVDQYNFDICERCSRTLVHTTIDVVRSCLSALKEEAKIESYATQQNARA